MSAFKAGVKQTDATCRTIADTMLLNVERKRLYSNAEFTDEQAQHRALVAHALQHHRWVQAVEGLTCLHD